MLYLMINPLFPGLTKIGTAVNPSSRLGSYNSHDPTKGFRFYRIHPMTIGRARSLEKRCKAVLAPWRVSGEWYRLNAWDVEGKVSHILEDY